MLSWLMFMTEISVEFLRIIAWCNKKDHHMFCTELVRVEQNGKGEVGVPETVRSELRLYKTV